MTNEQAIAVITTYLDECLFLPGSNWPQDMIEERLYGRWAANEVLERVIDNPFKDPLWIIDAWKFDLLKFMFVAEGVKQYDMFRIAYDITDDIYILIERRNDSE